MKRAQSMAQAAWSRPSLQLSSWSCMGPRRRPAATRTNSNIGKDSSESSSSRTETSEPLITSPRKTVTTIEAIELPVSTEGMVWNSEIEYSRSDKSGLNGEVDVNGDDLVGHNTHEDRMTEVELWQQLEHELYDQAEGEEADVAKEIREEEAEAIAEVRESELESSVPETKEVHRFFPPGKIMHIVKLLSDELEETDSRTPSDLDNSQLPESKVGIFLTSRSLYSKLRLSKTMIADHFMPVYRRQIERLIGELEKEDTCVNHDCREKAEVLL